MSSQNNTPGIWYFGTVTSSLDVAYTLAKEGRLAVFDSVFVRNQTAGRGQMRRAWISPPGNIYASLRLPEVPPFTTEYAAPAMGALVAEAFQRYGLPIRIKWPNDLVVPDQGEGRPAKLGGILFEERGGILLAGIGINLVSAPPEEELRDEHLYPAISLRSLENSENSENLPKQAANFWKGLVLHVRTVYKEGGDFSHTWKTVLARYLL